VQTHLEGNPMILKLKYFVISLMLFVAIAFTFERQAFAYVDPGSGLLVFQGISAVISGVLIYFRRRIKNIFTKSQPSASSPSLPPSSTIDHP